ncbi:MAG: hypothetical protein NZ561_07715, partial [Phycisphaerae bacterium]|nr:hypothetical protein [Phycisphaerae bacterium]MDW8261168.1 hypothetical protein [Phycisphaerales bacterium]
QTGSPDGFLPPPVAQEVHMSPRPSRSMLLSAVLALVPCAAAAPSVEPITDTAAADVENSRFQFEGEVNSNAVYVRSGPSENDYATTRLDKGAKVTVVGIRFDWLKILPPEGSFCYVAKAYVEKRNDGSVGRVTNTLNVRVGSSLLPMKTKVAAKLEPGQDVQIIGEQDEYFKIKPPPGVFYYVNKEFVDPVRRVEVPGLSPPPPPVSVTPAATDAPPHPAPQAVAGRESTPPAAASAASPKREPEAGAASPEPAESASNTAVAIPEAAAPAVETPGQSEVAAAERSPGPGAPSTQPALTVSADIEFDRLEAELREAAKLPITQQPVPRLLEAYQKLLTSPDLPESMRRIAEHRVQTLTVHNQTYQMALAHQAELADREARRRALQAEGDELMERLKKTGILFYAAVGTLRPSTLQGGEGTLYRLTDPVTGRTVVYLRSNDPALARMEGLFVGVQGEIRDDPQMKLRFITPTAIEPVDQRNVNRSITARITPPSLLPGGVLAGGNE